jgi:hypothetical protein
MGLGTLRRNYLEPLYKQGRCRACGKNRWCGREVCLPCRTPVDRRELLEAGVPCGSADALANIAKKFREQGHQRAQVAVLLTAIHPNLMANIRITPDDRLVPERKELHWQRRVGWVDFMPAGSQW